MPTSRKVSSNGFKPANTLCLDSYSVVLDCFGLFWLCFTWELNPLIEWIRAESTD